MSNRDGTRVLFDRIWSAGVQAAREGRHRELDYLVHMRRILRLPVIALNRFSVARAPAVA